MLFWRCFGIISLILLLHYHHFQLYLAGFKLRALCISGIWKLLLFTFVQQMCEFFICLTPYQLDEMMHNSSVFMYSTGWQQVHKSPRVTVPVFQSVWAVSITLSPPCKSSIPLWSHLQEVKLEGKHCKQVERPLPSALVRWDQLRKQAPRGSWALLNANTFSARVGNDQVSHSHCTKKEMYVSLLAHFSAFPSVIFEILKTLLVFFLNNSHFLYQKYHAGLFRKRRAQKAL